MAATGFCGAVREAAREDLGFAYTPSLAFLVEKEEEAEGEEEE